MKYLLIIIVFLTGCAGVTEKSLLASWNKTDKALLASYAVLSAVDAYQTDTMPDGAVELNPLLTDSEAGADMTKVYLWKAGALIALYFWSDYFEEYRTLSLGVANGMQGFVVLYNEGF